MELNLEGLIPATVLPMHADGSIDEDGLRSYIGWIHRQGRVAISINVDTGEGPHLTHDAKIRVLEIVRTVPNCLSSRGSLGHPPTPPSARHGTSRPRANARLVFPIPAISTQPGRLPG